MIVAVVLLVLAGVIGGLTAWVTHDVSATYGDPTGSDLGNLAWGPLAGVAVLLLVLVAIAVRAAPVGARRGVALVAALLLVAFAVAVPVANHVGLESKRSSTSQPPECGVGGETQAEFARIEHHGYFGGGDSDVTGCSFLMTVTDIPQALAAYEKELTGRGYDVVRAGDSLTATRDGFTFSVERGYQDIDDGRTLTVSLRTSG